MARKDSEKETDRPHYYSQFWLDVAAGRRVIGGPKPEDGEMIEQEPVEPVAAPRKAARSTNHSEHANGADGYREGAAARMHPAAEPDITEDESEEDEAGAFEIESNEDNLEMQDMDVEDADIPDMDLSAVDEDEEEDLFEDEEENEEEDEDQPEDWGRGRKKAKPARATKQPAKRPKRERRTY